IARSGEYGARHGGKVESASLSLFTLMVNPESGEFIDRDTLAAVAGIGADKREETIDVVSATSRQDRILALIDDASVADFVAARELLHAYIDHAERLSDPAVLAEHPGLSADSLRGIAEQTCLLPIFLAIPELVPDIAKRIQDDRLG